jgi:hypothetical protein
MRLLMIATHNSKLLLTQRRFWAKTSGTEEAFIPLVEAP